VCTQKDEKELDQTSKKTQLQWSQALDCSEQNNWKAGLATSAVEEPLSNNDVSNQLWCIMCTYDMSEFYTRRTCKPQQHCMVQSTAVQFESNAL
jgi:hypothetical protein